MPSSVKLSTAAMAAANPRVKLILGGMFGWPAARLPKAYRASVLEKDVSSSRHQAEL